MESQMESTCAEWCRSHYWQLQEKRGWRYAFHESVMVRYYEEANLDTSLLEPLVEFLKGEAWRDSFTVHNKPMDATGWKTTAVWYETRDGDVKEATKLKRTRIYHAIYKEGAQGGDGPYLMEDGCKWKVTHEFHWKVGSLPALPESASGVQYRLQGVARDDDTGLWNCVVERRETVQQDIAEYGTAKTVFEDRSEEQHLGVKQGSVAGTGKPASVAGGVMVRRQLRKNEDCTTDVVNETVKEKPVSGAVSETTRLARGTRTTTVNRNQPGQANLGPDDLSVRNERTEGGLWNQTITRFARILGWFRKTCRKTLFLHEHTETVVVETDPGFSHEVEAGGGIVHEKSVQRNEEGGFDVETRTREEQSVPGAVVETRKFIDGVQVTTVNRAQAAEASAAGLGIGESVRNEKTEGGRVDQTIVKASVEPVGRTGEACEQNALVHAHSRTEGMGSAAQSAEVQQVAGQVNTRRVRRTERGAWEVTDETRTAKPAQAKVEAGTEGRRTVTETYRNAAAIPAGPGGVNVEVEASATPNEFGLLDGTVRKVTHQPQSVTATGGSAAATVEVEAFRNETAPKDPGPGGVNEVNDVSQSPNEHGSFDGTLRKVKYKPQSVRATGGSQAATVEVEAFRNETQPKDPGPGGVNEVNDVSQSPNEHGSFDGTLRKVRYQPQSVKATGGSAAARVEVEAFRNETEPKDPGPGGVNEVNDVSQSPNEHGSFDGTLRKVRYQPLEAKANGGNMLADVETTVKENAEEQNPAETPQRGTVWDVSAQPNDHGSNRIVKTKRTAKAAIEEVEWQDIQKNGTRKVEYSCKLVVFRNQENVPSFAGWETCSPSVSINEYGLLDGVLHMRRFVGEEAVESGKESEGGTDRGKTRTVTKYYQKRDGKTYYRNYTATYNLYWGGSAAWLAKQMAQDSAKDFPEMGLVSGMRGGIMVVYTQLQAGQEMGPLSESGGSGNQGGAS